MGLTKFRRKWRYYFHSHGARSHLSTNMSSMLQLGPVNSAADDNSMIIQDPLEPRPGKAIKSSIWIKLTLFIGILVMVSSGLLAVILWLNTREELSMEIGRRLNAVAILRKEGIDDYFSGEIDKMVLVSSRIQIVNYLAEVPNVAKATAVYDLNSALSSIAEFKSAAIYNSEGSLDFATSQGIFPEQFPEDKFRQQSSSVEISLPKFSHETWEYLMSRGIFMNKTRVGVVASWINATTLEHLIYDRTGLQKTGELLVVVPKDAKTVQLVMPPRLDKTVTTIPCRGAVAAAIQNKSGIVKERDYRGVKVISAYTPMDYFNWGLLAKLDMSEAYAPIAHIEVVIIIMIIVILILGILASLCVAKIFTAPIIEMSNVASALGQGDLRARVNVKAVWFRDEIYELQTTFNSMANQIQDHNSNLEQKVMERTSALALANDVLASEVEERKRIELELQKAKDAAVAADKAKSEFLANMSHEIRTPLNGIINCTELCLDTQTSMEQQEYLELVKFSAKHLLRIITDILDFSKIEAGKLAMEEIQFSLHDQLERAVSVLAARAHKKTLDLACKVGHDVPEQLIGDPGRLFQIFVNLIGNSIKFTEGGEVVVSAEVRHFEQSKVELLFSVKDTGVGIPKSKQSLLFQAFSQVDSSTTRLYGGTGLGLVISSKLACAMGGRMWMESEGNGSTFWFTAVFSIPWSLNRSPSSFSEKLRGISVLLVDRNLTSLEVLDNTVKAWGMLTKTRTRVEDAKVALERAARQGRPFKVMVLDLWLNEGDGAEELINFVRQRPGLVGQTTLKQGRSFLNAERELDGIATFRQEDGSMFGGVDPEFPSVEQMQRALPAATSEIILKDFEGRDAETPSIVLLTSIDHADATRCRRLGVDIYTSKPIKRALLGRALQAAIGIKDGSEPLVQTQKEKLNMETLQKKVTRLHILVAEDNLVNQRVAVSLLQKWGHTTVLACNGAEAVEKSMHENFDLVLMDVQMPICDGFEATTRIREIEKAQKLRSTPIVAMTAHAMSGDWERCISAGMDRYISKPLNAKKLQELLQSIVDKM